MSRAPTEDNVQALRKTLANVNACADEINRLDNLIRESTNRLREVREQYENDHRLVISQLDAMDCQSSGNFGYEHRIVWMLRQLIEVPASAGDGGNGK